MVQEVKNRRGNRRRCLAIIATGLSACSVNPVTGDRELILVSETQELQMGAQAYVASQQSQGGPYDIDPELTRYVEDVGSRLAAVSDRPLPYEFVILNNSVPNAWALPGGKIAVNRGLLTELDSEAELAAVLGHEIVHAAARHSAQQMTRGMLSQAVVLATAVVASDEQYGALAVGGASLGAQLANSKYGRSAELEADHYGMTYMSRAGYDPAGAVRLQETFLRLDDGSHADWLSGLFASHPPSAERVAANRATAASLPAGGETNREVYRQKLKKTLDIEQAYIAYDQGRAALAEGDRPGASQHAAEALNLFPGEAHFHALEGDIRLLDKNYTDAVADYTRAIELRDDFFYYHLQRGLAKKALGDPAGATRDLERSQALMPTAPAELALGELAEQRGELDAAVAHYRSAAQAGGRYGEAGAVALARLDVPRNPGPYFELACGRDRQGKLVVAVRNQAPVSAAGIVIAVDTIDADGQPRRLMGEVPGTLQPGEAAQLTVAATAFAGGSCPAQVIGASVAP
jgi:predicted Zn-dependent protease